MYKGRFQIKDLDEIIKFRDDDIKDICLSIKFLEENEILPLQIKAFYKIKISYLLLIPDNVKTINTPIEYFIISNDIKKDKNNHGFGFLKLIKTINVRKS